MKPAPSLPNPSPPLSAQTLSAQRVFQSLETVLELRWLGGHAGADRVLWTPGTASAPFYGRFNWIHPPRLQIIGPEESAFLRQLEPAVRQGLLAAAVATSHTWLACGDLEPVAWLQDSAEAARLPLWYTPAPPEVALERLFSYRHGLAASTVMHGELLEVFGMGVLITGSSGVGKSELALELISRGHRLIADDTPNLTRITPEILEGTCPPTLADLLEVRGLGILNIRRMFGDSAIKRNKRVRLLIHLVRQEEVTVPAETRLAGLRDTKNILGIDIPTITLPIASGRNLAVLVECAVRDHILRLSGYRAEDDLIGRMDKALARPEPCV